MEWVSNTTALFDKLTDKTWNSGFGFGFAVHWMLWCDPNESHFSGICRAQVLSIPVAANYNTSTNCTLRWVGPAIGRHFGLSSIGLKGEKVIEWQKWTKISLLPIGVRFSGGPLVPGAYRKTDCSQSNDISTVCRPFVRPTGGLWRCVNSNYFYKRTPAHSCGTGKASDRCVYWSAETTVNKSQ